MGTEHPDEGTIHAWLDGALDAATSERIATHVAGCARCAGAVAEARGLIAGASRVVRALDDDTDSVRAGRSGLASAGSAGPAGARADASLWRLLRVTPARAAIAATLLVVAGLTLTHDWAARESAVLPPADAVVAGSSPAAALSAAAPARDPLLDSAVRRNVEQALPPRALEPAPGATVALAPEVPPSPLATDSSAPLKVAEGRIAARKARDSVPAAADRTQAPLVVAAAPGAGATMSAAPGAAPAPAPAAEVGDRPTARRALQVKKASGASAGNISETSSPQCYDITGPDGAAPGGLRLPAQVRLEGAGESGPMRLTGAGPSGASEMRWARQGADSLRLTLGTTVLVVGRAGGAVGGMVVRRVGCP